MANKKIMYSGLVVLLLFSVLGIIYTNIQQKNLEKESYHAPSPEDVARQYFTSWNNKDYANMYATISDGFKKIDPNTKDIATFKNFADSQGIKSINILNMQETSNDGETAHVDYLVEFILNDGRKQNFNDTFTLKLRQGDVIQGWKLIHPYGNNIDLS